MIDDRKDRRKQFKYTEKISDVRDSITDIVEPSGITNRGIVTHVIMSYDVYMKLKGNV